MGKSKPNKNYSKSRAQNAWIIFSNCYYKEIKKIEGKKIKRTDAMKSARNIWNLMSEEERLDYFIKYEKINELMQVEEANKHLDYTEKLTSITHDRFIIRTPGYYNLLRKSKKNKKKENEVFKEFIDEKAYF